MKVSSDQFVSVFVTVKDIFPELQDDYDTLRILLSGIDRNSALVACAQINFELSDHKTHREERNLTPEQRPMCSQRKLVPLFFTQAEMERLNAFRERRQSTEPIIFFREQVLELIRWIVLICRDEPGREIGFLNSAELNRFTKALLIAGSLWSRRVYRDDLIAARDKSSRAESLETVIRAFRNATTFRPNPMTGVCRGCQLLREIRAIDVTFEEMFERKTDLNLDDYNLAIFVILYLTLVLYSQAGLSAPLLDVIQLRKEIPGIEPALTHFLALASQTAEALRTALWESKSEPTTEDLAFFDLHPLMERPILLVPPDRLMILDAAFFAAQAILGPLFKVVKGACRNESRRIFGVFGRAFENYCFKLLRSRYPILSALLCGPLSLNLKIKDRSSKSLEIDAVLSLSDSRSAAIFEIKSAFVRDDWVSGNPEEYVEGLRQKYGATQEGGVKGIGQLARAISAVTTALSRPRDLDGIERIIPVLLVYDPLLDAPLHGEFFAQEFMIALAPDKVLRNGDMMNGNFRVTKLVLMTIDDLENLESSVKFSLLELLSRYSDDVPNRNISLNNYVTDSPSFSQNLRYSKSLQEEFLRTCESTTRRLAIPHEPNEGE